MDKPKKPSQAERDAAPDLLEALTYCYLDLMAVMPEFEPSGDRLHPGWQSIKDAHAVIAKAGGRCVHKEDQIVYFGLEKSSNG